MTSKKQILIRIGVFMLIAFGLTFGADIICIAVWGYEGWLESPFGLIVTLTMFAPMLANILTRIITKEGFYDLKLGFNFKGNVRYYAAAYFLPVLFGIIIAVIVNASHGNWRFENLSKLSFTEVFTSFISICVTPIFYYSFCCFGEEFGWRGYLNQKLESLTGTAGAVIIGGIIWGLWHGILVAHGYNFGSDHPVLGVMLMCVSCILLNAVMMWLTKKTNSVFPAVILHTVLDMLTMNFVSGLMISGISEETIRKVTPLQSGILTMIIPIALIGALCFIRLVRFDKKKY